MYICIHFTEINKKEASNKSCRQRYSQRYLVFFNGESRGYFFTYPRRRKSPIPFPSPPSWSSSSPQLRLGGEAFVVGHKLSSHCKFHSNTRTWYTHGEISTDPSSVAFHDWRSSVQWAQRGKREWRGDGCLARMVIKDFGGNYRPGKTRSA